MKSLWTSLLTAVTFAVSASADCSSLGSGASDSFPGTFQISAYDASTGTTTPLHLLVFMTVPETSFHVLSTASSPSIAWQGLAMSNGVIEAIPPEYYGAAGSIGAAYVNPEYPVPTAGPFPMWSNSFVQNELYCAIPNADGTAALALNGYESLFSLCTAYMSQTTPEAPVVLYNASASAYGDGYETYDGSSCKPITLLLEPQALS
ncbi:uncharacterized protein PHACADRAFT_135249 [Phanerochaete carnosa HHB-10118-sp]|uniref:Cellobiose dehydrogenase cytochrome domain-containing protein n=1 Tax=Phanerochaete carnosa (strain HHB-10118-sp) TaxID=650164 RepID=K5XEL3_PHACS|nr:uncharacterized protein PHACADRAFT_135249 [Phanerochaete carnosa HHB-10118-sp]EKM61517.1 hypothetical protein PHACADRAFT_135249 [Phanerochaete carnosa HHB-10118-sp]